MDHSEEIKQGGLEHLEKIPFDSKDNGSSEEKVSLWEAAKKRPRVILCCIVMSLSPLANGFVVIVISLITAMPAFQTVYGDASGVIPAQWLSLWTSMVAIGTVVGAMTSGPIADRLGCRFSVFIGGVIAVAGSIVCAFSDELVELQSRRILFLFAKIIVGLGLGFMLPASQTYISEITPAELKGPLLSAYTLSMVCGQVIAVAGVNSRINITSRMAYRLLLAIETVPTGIAALAPWLIPESPNYFVKRGDLSKATTAYTRLFPETQTQAESTVQLLARNLEHERGTQASDEAPTFKECLRGVNWRRTRIVCYANMLQSFVGIAMIQNATYFFELGGMSAQDALNVTTASLSCLILALLLSWWLIGRLGRRTMLLWATSVMAFIWLIIGIGGCFGTTTAFWFVGCAIVVNNFVYGLGVGSVYPVVAAETSTLRLRAKTQALGFAIQFLVSWAFQYAVPYMYSTSEGDLGGKVGFIFGGLSALALLVIFFEVPEMKGLRIEDLDALFEQSVATRAFQRTGNGGDQVEA